MTGHATKCPWQFPNWGFPGFSSVVRQMPGNLLHCPWIPLIPLSPFSLSLQRLTDETDVTNPGQMAYQDGNPWLWPKTVGVTTASGHHRLCQAIIIIIKRVVCHRVDWLALSQGTITHQVDLHVLQTPIFPAIQEMFGDEVFYLQQDVFHCTTIEMSGYTWMTLYLDDG